MWTSCILLNLKKSWNKSLPLSSFPSPLPSVWVPFLFSEFHHPHHLPCLFQRCHQACFSFHTSARAECSQFYSPVKSKQDSWDDMSFQYELICIPSHLYCCRNIKEFWQMQHYQKFHNGGLWENIFWSRSM